MTTSTRTCPACAAPIPPGALFCGRCGADAPTEVGADTPPHETDSVEALEARRSALQQALGTNFDVQRLVGRGGFGEVWAAFDLELRREVAIKVLRAELIATPGFRERFRREARAVAKLRHPGIVPIYHVGEVPGLVYFIMPLVEGVTLKTALEQNGRLPPEETMRILVEASSALREAHRRGIVHRDLKPENVMLEGPERHVLLMDFGIAQTEDMQDKELTGAGMVLGSPEYMSPEQATGKKGLDGRSDIYSLGVVAYRMLAGRLPFDAETARELLVKHVTTPPDPLENVPTALGQAIMRCLAKLPDQRWQTTDDFVTALTGQAPERISAAAMPGRTRRITANESLPGPRRWSSAVVAIGTVAALGAAALLLWRSQRLAGELVVSEQIASQYREATDSLRRLTAAFTAGALTGGSFLSSYEQLTGGLDERIGRDHGPVEERLASLPDGARRTIEGALNDLWLAGLYTARLAPQRSESPLCALDPLPGAVRLRDADPRANCWYALTPTPPAVSFPVEYQLVFRMAAAARGTAGLGMAWCAGAASCRVAFLWPGANFEWGTLRTGSNLRSEQLGRRIPALDGQHRLRVRYQDEVLRVWLDGVRVLERRSPDDAAFLSQPRDLRLVVQNASVELPNIEGVSVVGARRP